MNLSKKLFILKVILVYLMTLLPLFSAVIQGKMILNITVKGDELLTQTVQVQDNGTIDYPLYQDIPILGMTTKELQDILTLKLANYSDAPFVLISILSELPIKVQVMGQVKLPGSVTISPQANIQEVIKLAGGPTEFADLTQIKIAQANQTDEEASFYDFQQFLITGNLSLLPRIRDGDRIIILTSSKTNKIKILGSVKNPGYYVPLDSTSLFDLLYLAGGPADGANLTNIRILSYNSGRETDVTLNLQKYIDKGSLSDIPFVNAGDVIIVYRKSFTWSKTLTAVRDIVTLVTAWFVISQLFK